MREQETGKESPWFESNLLWAPVGFACGLLLAAIAPVKHDLRWLLWIVWPCFAMAVWQLARRTHEVWVVTILGTVLTGFCLWELNVWLRPEQQKTNLEAQAWQPIKLPSSPNLANAPASTEKPKPVRKAKYRVSFLPVPQHKPQVALTIPSVQQTVNAPNGIGTIGGTLVNPQVNNFGYMPKKLSVDQLENISALMRPFAQADQNDNLITCQLGNAESCAIAAQLVKAFRDAGWAGIGYAQDVTSEAPEPVLILVKADSFATDQTLTSKEGLPPGAYELAGALKKSGLSVFFAKDPLLSSSRFRVVVGTKP